MCKLIVSVAVLACALYLSYVQAEEKFHKVSDASCMGCVMKISPDDKELQASLQMAMSKANAGHQLVKIIRATKQVINGFKFNIEFIAKEAGTGKEKRCRVIYSTRLWKKNEAERLTISTYKCKEE